jgi:hypothetical protein
MKAGRITKDYYGSNHIVVDKVYCEDCEKSVSPRYKCENKFAFYDRMGHFFPAIMLSEYHIKYI